MSNLFTLFLAFLALASAQNLAFPTNATPGTPDDSLLAPLITAAYWHIVQGAAVDIGVGAEGSIWIIGKNFDEGGYGIYKWIQSLQTWKTMPGSALTVSVDPTGLGWVVTKQSAIFKWTIDGWFQMPGTASAVAVGADGSVWSLGSVKANRRGYKIYRYNELSKEWVLVSGAYGVRISVGPGGNAWVVDGINNIWHWNGLKWDQLPGKAVDIGVGADGSAYSVSTTSMFGGYQVQKWYEEENEWIPMKMGGVRVAADPNGNPYVLNTYGQILQYKPAALQSCNYDTWELIPGSASSISIGLDNSIWAVGAASENQENYILRWTPSSMSWDTYPGNTQWLSVDPSGNAWSIDTKNNIYRWSGIRWEKMPGNATRISIGADGSVWALGTQETYGGYEVYRWLPFKEKWEQVPGGMVRIAVDPRGVAWAINQQNQIYMWNGADWQQLSGSATDIGIGGNGALYVISTVADMGGFQIWRWNQTNQDWQTLPGAAGVQVTADSNGNPYIVNDFNQILRPKC